MEKNKIVQEEQKLEDEQKEYMMLGLRKIEGVAISKFKETKGRIERLVSRTRRKILG